jgi:hypothetical protein
VFLDEPLPYDLPVVGACEECNSSFSVHEQYLACLLECAIHGSVEPEGVERDKVKRILAENPSLRSRLRRSCTKDDNGNLAWKIEEDRVKTVILKLARGHAAFELGLPQLEQPDGIFFQPFVVMSQKQRDSFESATASSPLLWPEIGSRSFIRAAKTHHTRCDNRWLTIQADRYRYSVDQTEGLTIQMVLSEYLACSAVWSTS